ncbi:hypothetical protein NMG60_11008806 [Bertholletia excelsa]
MTAHWANTHLFSLVVITFVVLGCREVLGMRPLEGDEWAKKATSVINIHIQSLPRGPVTPSGKNPCTYIPGGGPGRCTLAQNEMNFAGHVAHAPPAFTDGMFKFGVASTTKDITQS